MLKVIARLLPLLLLFHFHPDSVAAQPLDRPSSLSLGDAVVTGFSGTTAPDPTKPRPAGRSAVDLTFINPDGPSARIIGLAQPGYVWDGRLFPAPKKFDVFAKDVGQVFGIALDDQTAPNIYLAATSAFGLQIVARGRDGLPERRKVGAPGTVWMKGQFGLDLQGDPGSIYKVDGTSGVVSLFAKVMLGGVPNPGPALGNLAYDAAHQQLFVSDLYTGMIHRFAIADGSEPGPPYDHGVSGRGAANLAPVPFNSGNRLNIASGGFDSENPDTWGFAPPERRVWGLAVQDGRLFYSVRNGATAEGPQIWSVGIADDGSFAADARWELDVPAQPGPYSVSDIAFSHQGAMILAQRAPLAASYDYSAFTQPGEPRVLRFWLKDPNDPPSPGRWKPAPEEYAIGFADNYRNTNGGVALGYGYDQNGALTTTACEAALWTTGQNLRNNPDLRSQLEPGGPLVVHGLQGSPADMVRDANTPPVISYFVDYDDKFDDPRASGHMGSVRIYTAPCAPAAYVRPVAANPVGGGGGGGGGGACVCPTPLVPGSLPGQCVCPQGTVLLGNECVPQICPPPLVQSPTPGVCICRQIGGACRCPPPLVAGPTPGECVWPLQAKQCVPTSGKLIIKKTVTSDTEIPLPASTPFPITLTCSPPPFTGSFSLTANGTYTVNNIPFGSTCTVSETLPALPANLCPRGTVPVWAPPPTYIPSSVVISGTTATITVHNSVRCDKVGSLIVTKEVIYDGPVALPSLNYPAAVTCGGTVTNLNLVNGVPQTISNIPLNTSCSVVEGPVPTPANICPPRTTPVWTTVYVPPLPIIITGMGITEFVKNTLTCSSVKVCPPPQVMNVDGICECPPPMVSGPVAGTCFCPRGTELVDGKCVPPEKNCVPPQVMNVDGICGCPHGTVLRGTRCVQPIECRPPLVLNAVGTACVCLPGTVRRGRACVHQLICHPPMIPNSAGTACGCPRGMAMVEGQCVSSERPNRREPGIRIPFGPGGFPEGGGEQPGRGNGGGGRR